MDLHSSVSQSECLVKEVDQKVVIVFKAAGNAPIMNSNKIRIPGSSRVSVLYEYLKKSFKSVLTEKDCLFVYCNQNFAPTINSFVIDLYVNFQVNGELVIYYALTEAWG